MKNILKLLFLFPMTLTISGCSSTNSEPSTVDVVVISGQSNAVGCTHSNCIARSIGHSKYQEYLTGYSDIQIAYDCWTVDEGPRFYSQNKSKDNNFVKVMLGQGNSLSTFGPEIGIAEQYHETRANKLFIIKLACGASNMKDHWVKKDSPMYPRLISFVKLQMQNLKDAGYIPTIKAFCWMQGEGDAWDGYYQEYYENTKEFAKHVREDLVELAGGNKELPFIDAGINKSPQWQYWRKVNEAKQQFAAESPNNIYIDTIGAGMHTDKEPFDTPDTAHYDTESEVQLGHLFAESFEQFLEPVE